jgi:UDP-N-acetylglucosamine--N-acetylmuramyl-(pentapeptide) pyrophosphoryl-undecaprenol N-acetylglucosamine transferase
VAALRVVFAGGGTGGHLYPAIAVAKRLQGRCTEVDIGFLGLRNGLEAQLVPREGFALHPVVAMPLKGRVRLAQVGAFGALAVGTWQALRLLRRLQPHLVIGSGGYVMGPALLAATVLRRPRVIMEQNVFPGLAVRAMARYAHRVFTAFPETQAYLPGQRVECTGIPIRQEICDIGMAETTPLKGILHILVFGGSQGARRINRAMIEAVPFFKEQQACIRVVHQTGETDYTDVVRAYRAVASTVEAYPFLHDMADRYRWAHLVVCRAGASTLAELTACGKPAILVPYPYAAHDHQYHNAMLLKQHGAVQVIPDAELTGPRLIAAIRLLLESPVCLQQQAQRSRQLGKPLAADAVVTACLQLLGRDTDGMNRHAQD